MTRSSNQPEIASPVVSPRLSPRASHVPAAAESLESRTLFAVAFQPIAYYTVSRKPESLAVGDFNNDTRPDMVSSSLLKDRISLLINQVDGSFVNTDNLDIDNPRAVATGDFNGDGNIDLVYTASRDSGNKDGGVNIRLGNGDGTFQSRLRYKLDNAGRAITVADLNGDGKPDLVVSANEKLAVFLNNGDGTLADRVKYKGLESKTTEILAADVNNDGAPDLLAATPRTGVSVLFGQLSGGLPTGAFSTKPTVIFPGRNAISLNVADFNGDGNLDLAVGNSDFRVSGLNVVLGHGDGTFEPRNPYPTKNFIQTARVGDFTGDGIDDIAVGSAVGPYQFFTGDGTGNFTLTDELKGGASLDRGVSKTVTADFNLDGKLDLASLIYRRSRVAVRLSVFG